MSKPKKIRRVLYRKLLDKRIPLVSYDLYEDEHRKYAFLTFNNSTIYTVKSFKVKITFYTMEHIGLNTLYFEFDTPVFYSHHNYSPDEPLVFPKNAEGFNYEILDVDIPSYKTKNVQSLRIHGVPKDFYPANKTSIKGSDISIAKSHWIPCVAILGCSLLGSVPYFAINMATNISEVANNYYDAGTMFTYNGVTYQTIDEKNSVSVINADEWTISINSPFMYDDKTFNITEIREYAFSGDKYNDSIEIKGSGEYPIAIQPYAFELSSIYNMAFWNCKIDKESVRCSYLNNVSLYSCSVFEGAFTSCPSLMYVYITKDTDFENHAFPNGVNINYM